MSEDTKEYIDDDFIDDDENVSQNQFLTFKVVNETYGINILQVVEIIRMIKITNIPQTFDFIKGVINLRGKIIPVMDVRKRFNVEESNYDERTCIIVINMRDIDMGIIVDRIADVVEIPKENIDPMPQMNSDDSQRYVRGIGKIDNEVKILLDLDKLLFEDEFDKIKELSNEGAE